MARPLIRVVSPDAKKVVKDIRLAIGRIGQVGKRRAEDFTRMAGLSVSRHFRKMEFGGSDSSALGTTPFWSTDRHPLNVARRRFLYGESASRFPLLGPTRHIEQAFTGAASSGGASPGLGRSVFRHSGTGRWARIGAKHQFGENTTFTFGGQTATFDLPVREFLYWDMAMAREVREIVANEWNKLKRGQAT